MDGSVVIRRVVSKQTHRPGEICWSVSINEKTEVMHHDTKRDAVKAIEKLVKKESVK